VNEENDDFLTRPSDWRQFLIQICIGRACFNSPSSQQVSVDQSYKVIFEVLISD